MDKQAEVLKILMIGPFPNPINGMTIANKMLLDGLRKKGDFVEFIDSDTEKNIESLNKQGKFNLKKIINSFKPIFKGSFKILFSNFKVIYITPAQSYMGFMKYSLFINLAFIKKIPCYIHIHGGYIRKMYDECDVKKQSSLKKLFNRCTGIIVLGNSLKNMFKGLVDDKKIYICANGVSDEFFISEYELEEKLRSINGEAQIKMLYLSNLMESKGILKVLEACKILKKHKIDFHIDVAGAIEEEIKDKIFEYFDFLGDSLTYHGVVSGEKKRQLLKNNNIFLLPINYEYEGQPIAILEAMAMGNVIISTNKGGIKDVITNGVNGVVCNNSEESIVKAICTINENKKSFIIKNYDEVKNKFRQNIFIEDIRKILKSF